MLEDYLCQIGLTKRESSVYIELLKIGPQAVSTIAIKTLLKRTTIYSILKSLMDKGLVATFKKEGIQFFIANDPNCLVSFLDGKSETYEFYRSQILSVIPKFRSLNGNQVIDKPVVAYYNGLESIKYILKESIKCDGEHLIFLPLDDLFSPILFTYLTDLFQISFDNKKYNLKLIVPNKKEVRDFFCKNFNKEKIINNLVFVSFKEYETFFKSFVNMYGNKVSMFNLEKGQEYVVLIEGKEVYNLQKSLFDMIWTFNQFNI